MGSDALKKRNNNPYHIDYKRQTKLAFMYTDSPFTFEEELTNLLNKHSKENGSGTPDYILAKYLFECLENFNHALQSREKHFGRKVGQSIIKS